MHLEPIHWVMIGIFLLFWLIIGVFIGLFIAVAFLEKQYINDFVPAPSGQPLADSPYLDAMNDAARRLGFKSLGVLLQNRKSRIYRAQLAAWLSPEGNILLLIAGGRTAGVTIRRSILISIATPNQMIQTQDRAAVVDLSGMTDQKILLNADLDELVACHRDRLAFWAGQVRIFSAQNVLSEWESVRRVRAEQLVRMGLAKFLNQEQTIYRHTFKGAWLQYEIGFRSQLADAKNQMDRASKKRPGAR